MLTYPGCHQRWRVHGPGNKDRRYIRVPCHSTSSLIATQSHSKDALTAHLHQLMAAGHSSSNPHPKAQKLKTEQSMNPPEGLKLNVQTHPKHRLSLRCSQRQQCQVGPCFTATLWLYPCPSWLTNSCTPSTAASAIAGSSGHLQEREARPARLSPSSTACCTLTLALLGSRSCLPFQIQ